MSTHFIQMLQNPAFTYHAVVIGGSEPSGLSFSLLHMHHIMDLSNYIHNVPMLLSLSTKRPCHITHPQCTHAIWSIHNVPILNYSFMMCPCLYYLSITWACNFTQYTQAKIHPQWAHVIITFFLHCVHAFLFGQMPMPYLQLIHNMVMFHVLWRISDQVRALIHVLLFSVNTQLTSEHFK